MVWERGGRRRAYTFRRSSRGRSRNRNSTWLSCCKEEMIVSCDEEVGLRSAESGAGAAVAADMLNCSSSALTMLNFWFHLGVGFLGRYLKTG